MEYIDNYNLEGKRINIAMCRHCKNQIDVTGMLEVTFNGSKTTNMLNVLEKSAGCCNFPDYYFNVSE